MFGSVFCFLSRCFENTECFLFPVFSIMFQRFRHSDIIWILQRFGDIGCVNQNTIGGKSKDVVKYSKHFYLCAEFKFWEFWFLSRIDSWKFHTLNEEIYHFRESKFLTIVWVLEWIWMLIQRADFIKWPGIWLFILFRVFIHQPRLRHHPSLLFRRELDLVYIWFVVVSDRHLKRFYKKILHLSPVFAFPRPPFPSACPSNCALLYNHWAPRGFLSPGTGVRQDLCRRVRRPSRRLLPWLSM